jgi:Fic family protein
MPHVWEPITDLPPNCKSLTEGELEPLLQFWNDQRADLERTGVSSTFSQRLAREWSIETGQIEGVYNIDRGVTQTLIERGINADLIPPEPGQKTPELVAAIIGDHLDVLEGLFQFVRGDRPMSKSYIHEMHAALLRHQDTTMVMDQFGNTFAAQLVKGAYKQRANNPLRPDGTVHEYCPPEHVESEMGRLLEMHKQHQAAAVPIEVEAAWLHHRFTQVHPYQDGNGRVARALASLGFIKEGWFPVVVTREDRPRYIDALEVADDGDLRSLIAFFVDVQKRALFQATQAAADVLQVRTVDEAIAAAKRVLTGPGKKLDPRVWLIAKDNAARLMEIARKRVDQVCRSMQKEIGKERPDFQFGVRDSSTYVPENLVGYKPNTEEFEQGYALSIRRQNLMEIGVNAHAIGSKFRGLIGIAVVVRRWDLHFEAASKESFQVNYAEPYESTERRFRPWLEGSLVNALTIWRKNL